MWALVQNNPVMVAIIVIAVLIAIALHVGIYLVIKRLVNRELPPASDE
jgi:uncharacterized protein YneF (UPF0154 family)